MGVERTERRRSVKAASSRIESGVAGFSNMLPGRQAVVASMAARHLAHRRENGQYLNRCRDIHSAAQREEAEQGGVTICARHSRIQWSIREKRDVSTERFQSHSIREKNK